MILAAISESKISDTKLSAASVNAEQKPIISANWDCSRARWLPAVTSLSTHRKLVLDETRSADRSNHGFRFLEDLQIKELRSTKWEFEERLTYFA